jgi:hypothetical protein
MIPYLHPMLNVRSRTLEGLGIHIELGMTEIHRILIREYFGKKSLLKSRRKSASIKANK